MVETTLENERPIMLSEVKEILLKTEKRDGEMNFRANKTKEYLALFSKQEFKKQKEFYDKVTALDIPRLKDRQIVKIIDLMPESMDELKMLFVGENTTVNQDNLKKILEIVKEYA